MGLQKQSPRKSWQISHQNLNSKVPSIAHFNNGIFAATMISIEIVVDITSYEST